MNRIGKMKDIVVHPKFMGQDLHNLEILCLECGCRVKGKESWRASVIKWVKWHMEDHEHFSLGNKHALKLREKSSNGRYFLKWIYGGVGNRLQRVWN